MNKYLEVLHGKKIVTGYVVEVQQIFRDFTACRTSASSLKAVNFLPFQQFNRMQNFCILAEFSKFLAYWLLKECIISACQEIVTAYVIEVQQFSTGFTACRISAFSAYFNNCTGCITSSSQENLSLPIQCSFRKFSPILPRAEFLRLG